MSVKGKHMLPFLQKMFKLQTKLSERIADMVISSGKGGYLALAVCGLMTVPLLILMEVMSFAEFGKILR